MADGTLEPVPEALADDPHDARVLPLTDDFATAYHAVMGADLAEGDARGGPSLGATHVVNTSTNGGLAQVLGDLTGGRGPEAVIDAASSAASMRSSTESVQPGGTVSWVGMEVFLGAPELSWDQCFMRNLTIRGGIAPVKRYLAELWRSSSEGSSTRRRC